LVLKHHDENLFLRALLCLKNGLVIKVDLSMGIILIVDFKHRCSFFLGAKKSSTRESPDEREEVFSEGNLSSL
jgi:hypothetical protein